MTGTTATEEERRARQNSSAAACAQARFDRGQRELTPDEAALCTHISRFGSDGYPVRKLGREWTWDFRSLKAPTLYDRKWKAIEAFETFHLILLGVRGLVAQESALREISSEELLRIAEIPETVVSLKLVCRKELKRREEGGRS